MGKIRVVKG